MMSPGRWWMMGMVVALAGPAVGQEFDLGEHRALKVLYAGPGGSREDAWSEFLRQNFDEVGVIGLQELNQAAADPYDVIVADWKSQYGNDGYERGEGLEFPSLQLGAGFDRPVVCVSSVASFVARGSKLDWL